MRRLLEYSTKLDHEIGLSEALKIAQQHALQTKIDPTHYLITVACEAGLSWRVWSRQRVKILIRYSNMSLIPKAGSSSQQ